MCRTWSHQVATVNLFEVIIPVTNEVTHEPHIHYYTFSAAQAQAFRYTVGYTLGVEIEVRYHVGLPEGTSLACEACDTKRERLVLEYNEW